MNDTINKSVEIDSEGLAGELGISRDDADTVVNDILPVLRRKFELVAVKSGSATIDMGKIKEIIKDDLPKVLGNYALDDLSDNRSFLIYLVKKFFSLKDKQAAAMVDKLTRKSSGALATQLADQLGIHPSKFDKFTKKIIPKIKSYSKSMLRKKLNTEKRIENPKQVYQFIVDNIFIDEFENYPFIRSTTDADNRAILKPEALNTAFQLLGKWTREVAAENR